MGEDIGFKKLHWTQLAIVALLGGAPLWMVLSVWDFTDQRSGWQIFVRSNSFAIPLIEFVVVLAAMAIGFSPLRAINRLPLSVKLIVLVWLPITIWTSFQPGNDYLAAAIGMMKLFFAGLLLLALIELRRMLDDRLFIGIWLAVGCGAVLYIALWIMQILIAEPSGEEWIVQVPGVNNVRHIGHFAFAGFFAGLVCCISFRDNPNWIVRWGIPVLLAASSLGLALWPGSRGPTLAVICGMLIVVVLGAGIRKQLCAFFAMSALLSAAVVAMLPVPHPIYGLWGASGMADVQAGATQDASSGRIQFWRETVERIEENPMLGWGVEQFSTSGPNFMHGTRHPHNFILQVMFAGGAVSVLLTGLVMLFALKNWRWPRQAGIRLAGTGCVGGIAVYSLYDGPLYFSYPIMIFLLAIATSISPPPRPSPDR
jgi:O-antigen ligase